MNKLITILSLSLSLSLFAFTKAYALDLPEGWSEVKTDKPQTIMYSNQAKNYGVVITANEKQGVELEKIAQEISNKYKCMDFSKEEDGSYTFLCMMENNFVANIVADGPEQDQFTLIIITSPDDVGLTQGAQIVGNLAK